MNLPNKITVSRFVMAVGVFILLSIIVPGSKENSYLWDIILVLYFIAGVSDLLDGYLARKYNLVSTFGRIADPFVDKIMICGTFILLIPHLPGLLQSWMVVVVIGREFLVSGIRGFAESQGVAFPSNQWGKYKTLTQNTTNLMAFIYLGHFSGIELWKTTIFVLIIAVLFMTVMSGLIYILNSKKVFQDENSF